MEILVIGSFLHIKFFELDSWRGWWSFWNEDFF